MGAEIFLRRHMKFIKLQTKAFHLTLDFFPLHFLREIIQLIKLDFGLFYSLLSSLIEKKKTFFLTN